MRPPVSSRPRAIATWLQSHALSRPIWRWAALLACVAALAACGKSKGGGSQLGGESHFLGNCTQGCGALSCIAGICTRPCSAPAACGDLDGQAVCRIEAGQTAGFCDVACSSEAACPEGDLSCQVGYCRSESNPDAGLPAESVSGELSDTIPRTASGLPLRCVDSTTLSGPIIEINGKLQLETLEGCEEIDGDLSVGAVNDLRPLHALKRVNGQFSLGASAFDSFAGLEQLESVVGLGLNEVTVLHPSPLPQLRQLTYLSLAYTDLPDLSLVRNAAGVTTLNLQFNSPMQSLDGLATELLDHVNLQSNSSLTDIRVLSGVSTLGAISISETPLQKLDGLSQLLSIGSLYLVGNLQLANLDGLANVEVIRDLTVKGCSSLTHLPEFSQLTELESLQLEDNQRLEIASSFSVLRSANLFIHDGGMVGRAEFPKLESSSSSVEISGNAGLTELNLPVFRECPLLAIENNLNLAALALPGLVPGGSIYVERNERLGSVDLPLLATPDRYLDHLVIALNPALEADAIHVGQTQGWNYQLLGANAGVAVTGSALRDQQLDPCPWEGDGHCDACAAQLGEAHTGAEFCRPQLCAFGTDISDCNSPDAGP